MLLYNSKIARMEQSQADDEYYRNLLYIVFTDYTHIGVLATSIRYINTTSSS